MSGVELAVLSVAVSAVSAVSQIKAAQEKRKCMICRLTQQEYKVK